MRQHPPATKRTGRPAVLSPAIAGRLRASIVAGQWLPGSRLPTRRELCDTFDCSTITLQMAMDALTAEGFIHSDGRHGTFVQERPPHLTDIAVVYPPVQAPNHFWEAIDATVKHWTAGPYRLTNWFGVDAHEDNPTYCALRERAEQGSLAGLLFVTSPHFFLRSPLLLRPGIPRVAVASNWRHRDIPLSTIECKHASFAERAVARLAQAGCRRLAVVTFPSDGYETWLEACGRHGVELRPYWFQSVSQGAAGTGRNVARLLFRPGQVDCPDALIITDDNLVEATTAGMADAGVRVPEGVRVLAHCNFPWPTKSAFPIERLGWDTRGILALALELLDQARVKPSLKHVRVDAVFEEEIQALPHREHKTETV